MGDRQLDIYKYGSKFLSIPKWIPGRLNGDDFVEFKWCNELEPIVNRYTVAIESLDTAGSTMRGISKLRQFVELPYVLLGHAPLIALIPDSKDLPIFTSVLIRGSLYVIPETNGVNGTYEMDREGMLRLN